MNIEEIRNIYQKFSLETFQYCCVEIHKEYEYYGIKLEGEFMLMHNANWEEVVQVLIEY